MSFQEGNVIVYRMSRDRRDQLELFVDIWVKAVGEGEKMPRDAGHLIPEDEWNWVKGEVRKRLEIGTGKEVS